jgi:hypothetical protein
MARKMFSVAKMPPLNPFHQAVALSVTYAVFLKERKPMGGFGLVLISSTGAVKIAAPTFCFAPFEPPFFNEFRS